MSLPKIVTPRFPLEFPDGKKVVVRQWLTKEFKAIMSAYNTQSTAVLVTTLSAVLRDCIVEPKDFDFDSLKPYEAEWLFLQLYYISVGGTLDIALTCTTHDPNGVERQNPQTGEIEHICGSTFTIPVDLGDIEYTEMPDNTFKLSDNIILKMKYPSWDKWAEVSELMDTSLEELAKDSSKELPPEKSVDDYKEGEINDDTKTAAKIIYRCMDSIWVDDEMWSEPFTEDEFIEWVDGFPSSALSKVSEFVSMIPQIHYESEFKCPKCGTSHKWHMMGLADFLK